MHAWTFSALLKAEQAWPGDSASAVTSGSQSPVFRGSCWLALCRFPFAEPLTLHSGETVSSAQVIEAMAQFMGPERLARMEQVIIRTLPESRRSSSVLLRSVTSMPLPQRAFQ